jgi:hypothetical protein
VNGLLAKRNYTSRNDFAACKKPGIDAVGMVTCHKKAIDAEVVILPKVNNPSEFTEWLKGIKGKFVLMAQYQRSGRPDYQLKEFYSGNCTKSLKHKEIKMLKISGL